MSAWKPIETAPKDGRDILVWAVTPYGSGYRSIAHWHGSAMRWVMEIDDQESRSDDIKMWTELPDPPEI